MDGHVLQSGMILGGRYRIEDLVGEVAGSRSWRAVDVILNRSVGVQALSSADPRSVSFLDAARRSTAVLDPRFVRVLDAVADEGGVTYVVREWAHAVPLAVLLREGPLANRRAASLVSGVADAMARAHEVGVYHLRLNPATILVKETEAVRISGLATDSTLWTSDAVPTTSGVPTAQVLHPEQLDVVALGWVLYACLAARWPGGRRSFDLAPAPREHGRLLRPRQVRAGVSRDVDTVCDRILGEPPRHHAPPLRSARDIAAALALVGEDEAMLVDDSPSLGGDPTIRTSAPGSNGFPPGAPPALLPLRPATGSSTPSSTAGGHLWPPASGRTRRPGAEARALVALGVALLVAMAAVLAFFIGRNSVSGEPDERASSATPLTSAAAPRPLRLRAASDFDPQGDLSENPEEALWAIDSNPGTTWTTSQYAGDPQLGNLKNGVGLLLDLGTPQQATSMRVTFGDAPTQYEIWAAPQGTTDTPTQLSELRRLASRQAFSAVSRVQFPASVETRYLLVWLTSLPEEVPGYYRGVIRDIEVEGMP